MNVHLKENGFLRSVFGLEDIEGDKTQAAKGNRFERVNPRRREMPLVHPSLVLAIGQQDRFQNAYASSEENSC